MDESISQNREVTRSRIRRLAIATACVTAAATLTTGGGFLLTIPLICGVIAESGSPRRGRWLMWVGAAYLSVTLLPMEIVILPEFITEFRSYHRLGGLGPILAPLWIASIFLIICCDVALLIDAVKTRRNRVASESLSPTMADWMVWISAVLFSVFSFWGIPFLVRAYRRGFDRSNILLTDLAIILIATVFDIALAVDAAKMWRARGMGETNVDPSAS